MEPGRLSAGSTVLDEWLKAKEIAKALKVSERHVHRLPITRVVLGPRCVRFSALSLKAYLQEQVAHA